MATERRADGRFSGAQLAFPQWSQKKQDFLYLVQSYALGLAAHDELPSKWVLYVCSMALDVHEDCLPDDLGSLSVITEEFVKYAVSPKDEVDPPCWLMNMRSRFSKKAYKVERPRSASRKRLVKRPSREPISDQSP